jgi:hypothetical protein
MNTHDPWVVRWRKSSYSTNTGGNCVEVAALFRKSSHSGDTGGQCVEVAGLPGMIAVRDSKDPTGPALTLDRRAFRTLLTQLRTDA